MEKSKFESENGNLYFYKAMQHRWEFAETADPQVEDVSYHLSLDAAILAADNINLDLDFEAQVDRIGIDEDDFDESLSFRQMDEVASDVETVYTGAHNKGRELSSDDIVISYRHHTYMNYSYDITGVDFVRNTNLKFEADLRNDKDSTSAEYLAVVDNIDELAEMYDRGSYAPFNKINKGSAHITEFLKENGHPDYVETEENEEAD